MAKSRKGFRKFGGVKVKQVSKGKGNRRKKTGGGGGY
jgi:hypothetical protein